MERQCYKAQKQAPSKYARMHKIKRWCPRPPYNSNENCTGNLKIEKAKAILPAKNNLGGQAGDVLTILGKDIGVDSVFALWIMLARVRIVRCQGKRAYRWDLLREVDRLGDGDNALLNRALEVDVLDLLAQVRLGVHQPDQTILDLEIDVCALLDGLVDGSDSLDNQLGATVSFVSTCVSISLVEPLHRPLTRTLLGD